MGRLGTASDDDVTLGEDEEERYSHDEDAIEEKKIGERPKYSCNQCRSAKKTCDRGLPACSRCLDRSFDCAYRENYKKASGRRKTMVRQPEISYAKVTQEDVVRLCRERVAYCLVMDAFHGETSGPSQSSQIEPASNVPASATERFEKQIAADINRAVAFIEDPTMLEAIHRAASFQQATPIGEGIFSSMDGSALLAFTLLAQELIKDALDNIDLSEDM